MSLLLRRRFLPPRFPTPDPRLLLRVVSLHLLQQHQQLQRQITIIKKKTLWMIFQMTSKTRTRRMIRLINNNISIHYHRLHHYQSNINPTKIYLRPLVAGNLEMYLKKSQCLLQIHFRPLVTITITPLKKTMALHMSKKYHHHQTALL